MLFAVVGELSEEGFGEWLVEVVAVELAVELFELTAELNVLLNVLLEWAAL